MFNKILLASDGSDHAVRAAKRAIYFARHNPDCKITTVFVIDPETSKYDILRNGSRSAVEFSRKKRLKTTEDMMKDYEVPYEIIFLKGEPAATLVQYAKEHEFDLVILGSRGLNAIQEIMLGSVSHKVAKHVHCPVLIVK